MGGLRRLEPASEEVKTAVDGIVNGFVFSFENAGQIVARTMYYEAQDLPRDWLQAYVRGVQRVTPESIHRVFIDNLRPEEMTVLIVGDTVRTDMQGLRSIAPVRVLSESGPTLRHRP